MPRVIRWKQRRPTLSFSTAPCITDISVNRARVGTSVAVTITGACGNFRNCAQGTPPTVKFGTLSATSVVVVDRFTITCMSPAALAPGTVDITVTVGCCS